MKRVAAGIVLAAILFAVGFGVPRHGRKADRQPNGVTRYSTTYIIYAETTWQVDPPTRSAGR